MAEPKHLPAVRPVYEAGAVERAEVDAVYLPSTLPNLADLEIIDRIADRAAKSAYIAGARTAERAAMLILAGRELRVGPWQALSGIHIIKERPSISAHLMGALVQRFIREQRGGVFRATEQTSERCTIEYRRPEWGESSFVTWTIEDARAAGLVQPDSNWRKYPRQMLFSRATGEAARSGFPDVVQGLYTPEELEDAPWSPPEPAPHPAAVREVPAPAAPAGPAALDDPDAVRRRAISALHAHVGERYDGDPHKAVKLLQAHLYDGYGGDGEGGDLRSIESLTNVNVWTIEALREFYRAIRDLPAADFAMIVTSEDEPDEAAGGVEVAGRTVDPETGEVVYRDADGEWVIEPPTEREDDLAEFRREARDCRTLDGWKALGVRAGTDEERWLVLAAETMSAGTIDALRRQARQQGANTAAVEDAFNRRRRQVLAPVEAATP